MNRKLAACTALGAVLTAASPAGAQEFVSSYTRHDYRRCQSSPASGDTAERVCRGAAGIRVVWTAEADTTSLAFGRRTLGETLFEGFDFHEVGETVEWRGPRGQRPVVAIVRYRAGRSPDRLDTTRLVIHRIGADGISCILGSVDGRANDSNAAARRLADRAGAGFRCGRDARIDL